MLTFLKVPRRLALWLIAILTAAASLVSFAESYRALYLWSSLHGLTGTWAFIWPLQIDVFIAIGEVALFVGLVDRWDTRKRIFPWAVTLAGLAVSVAGNVGHVQSNEITFRATAAVPPLAAWASLIVGMGVLKRVVDLYSKHESGTAKNKYLSFLTRPGTAPPEATFSGQTALAASPRTQERAPKAAKAPKPAKAVTPRRPIKDVLAEAEKEYQPELAAGQLPGFRDIRSRSGVGQDRAETVRDHLATLMEDHDTALREVETVEPVGAQVLPVPEKPFDPDATESFATVGHPAPGQPVGPRSYQQLPVTPQGHRNRTVN